jgi:predicted MFS family arabinose efflux permease
LCGTGIGAAVVPVLSQKLAAAYGWSGGYFGLAGVFALLVLPPVLLLFRTASGMRSSARPVSPPSPVATEGLSARDGFVSPAFLKLAPAVLLFGITSCALTVTVVPILMTKGLDVAEAAGLAAFIGIGSIVGRLTGGVLLDYVDARWIAACSVLIPIGFAGLLLAGPATNLTIGLACFLLGLSTGTEVDACAYLAARHFGLRAFGTLFGTINGMVFFGAGVAPFIANYVYDVTRTYDTVLWGMIPLCLLSALLFVWMGRRSAASAARAVASATG